MNFKKLNQELNEELSKEFEGRMDEKRKEIEAIVSEYKEKGLKVGVTFASFDETPEGCIDSLALTIATPTMVASFFDHTVKKMPAVTTAWRLLKLQDML